jgi:hypothetical protein
MAQNVPSRLESGELFPTDDPLPASALIGRNQDVDRISHQLRQRINIVLPGPRRTGKTSVCLAALDQVRRKNLHILYLDLRKVSDIGELAEALVVKAFESQPILGKAVHYAIEGGRTLLEGISITASGSLALYTGDPTWEFLGLALTPDLRRDPNKHLDYALSLPEKLASAGKKRWLLFLDEFQEIEALGELEREDGGKRLLHKLRGYFDSSPSCRYLFAGSKEHMLRDIFGKSASPFFNFGSFDRLEPIPASEWNAGLKRKLAQDQCLIDDQALARLIELGEGHPRATMLIAQQTHSVAVAAGTWAIGGILVETGYRNALRSEKTKHELIVEHIRTLGGKGTQRLTLKVAKKIANGVTVYPGKEADESIRRALIALRDAGIIDQEKSRAPWYIVDPLFKRYLLDLDPFRAEPNGIS